MNKSLLGALLLSVLFVLPVFAFGVTNPIGSDTILVRMVSNSDSKPLQGDGGAVYCGDITYSGSRTDKYLFEINKNCGQDLTYKCPNGFTLASGMIRSVSVSRVLSLKPDPYNVRCDPSTTPVTTGTGVSTGRPEIVAASSRVANTENKWIVRWELKNAKDGDAISCSISSESGALMINPDTGFPLVSKTSSDRKGEFATENNLFGTLRYTIDCINSSTMEVVTKTVTVGTTSTQGDCIRAAQSAFGLSPTGSYNQVLFDALVDYQVGFQLISNSRSPSAGYIGPLTQSKLGIRSSCPVSSSGQQVPIIPPFGMVYGGTASNAWSGQQTAFSSVKDTGNYTPVITVSPENLVISKGDSANIRWSVANVLDADNKYVSSAGCELEIYKDDISQSKGAVSPQDINYAGKTDPLNTVGIYDYQLTCENHGFKSSRILRIEVKDKAVSQAGTGDPVVTVSPQTLATVKGDSPNLTWGASNVLDQSGSYLPGVSCALDTYKNGERLALSVPLSAKNLNYVGQTEPLTQDGVYRYTLKCSNAAGKQASASITIIVGQSSGVPIVSVDPTSVTVGQGQRAKVRWNVTNVLNSSGNYLPYTECFVTSFLKNKQTGRYDETADSSVPAKNLNFDGLTDPLNTPGEYKYQLECMNNSLGSAGWAAGVLFVNVTPGAGAATVTALPGAPTIAFPNVKTPEQNCISATQNSLGLTGTGTYDQNLFNALSARQVSSGLLIENSPFLGNIGPGTKTLLNINPYCTSGVGTIFPPTGISRSGGNVLNTPTQVSLTTPTVPQRPSIISTFGRDQSIDVGYSVAGNGGSPIKNAKVTCGSSSVQGNTTPLTVSGLAIRTEYTCTVVVANSVGTSTESAPVKATTGTGAATVAPVTVASVSSIIPSGTALITVSSSQGGTITGSPDITNGTVSVGTGGTVTFTVSTSTGYRIAAVTYDDQDKTSLGVTSGNRTTYTFTGSSLSSGAHRFVVLFTNAAVSADPVITLDGQPYDKTGNNAVNVTQGNTANISWHVEPTSAICTLSNGVSQSTMTQAQKSGYITVGPFNELGTFTHTMICRNTSTSQAVQRVLVINVNPVPGSVTPSISISVSVNGASHTITNNTANPDGQIVDIAYGSTPNIVWSVSNTTNCTLNGSPSQLSGTVNTTAFTVANASYPYAVSCNNGSLNKSFKIRVGAAPVQTAPTTPSIYVTVGGQPINNNQTINVAHGSTPSIYWNVSPTSSTCTRNGATLLPDQMSGFDNTTFNNTGTSNISYPYSVYCSNGSLSGSLNASILFTISVSPAPVQTTTVTAPVCGSVINLSSVSVPITNSSSGLCSSPSVLSGSVTNPTGNRFVWKCANSIGNALDCGVNYNSAQTSVSGTTGTTASSPTYSYYTITASAGPGGLVTPRGTTTYIAGQTVSVGIEASPGYEISDVLVDGVSVGKSTRVPFSSLGANHTLSASFTVVNQALASTVVICGTAVDGGPVPSAPTSASDLCASGSSISGLVWLNPDNNWVWICNNSAGNWKSCGVAKTPSTPVVPNATVSLSQSSTVTNYGVPFSVSWTSTYATACDVKVRQNGGAWSTWYTSTSGNTGDLKPEAGVWEAEATCSPGNVSSGILSHTVNPPAVQNVSFSLSNVSGGSANISWSSSPPATCSISYMYTESSASQYYTPLGRSFGWTDTGLRGSSGSSPVSMSWPGNYVAELHCTGSLGIKKEFLYHTTPAPSSPTSYEPPSSQVASVFNAIFGTNNAQSTNARFVYNWNNNLQIGSDNYADISALQLVLSVEVVYSGEISGKFYNQTYQAVKDFQKKYNIDQTGFVGPLTRAKLNELYGK